MYGNSEISQFKAKYDFIVENKIIPKLEKVNDERGFKYRIWGIVISMPISIGLGYLAYLCSILEDWLYVLSFVCLAIIIPGIVALALEEYLLKKFELKLKTPILQELLTSIPDFYWQETPVVPEKEIEQILIFPKAKDCTKSFDDNFLGKFKGIPFAAGVCSYVFYSKRSIPFDFQGVIIKIKMNKNFSGHTVVVPNKKVMNTELNSDFGYFDYYGDLKKAGLEQVNLEDVAFNSRFVVYSTDQIEARYLLTPSFMEKLKDFKEAYLANEIYCVFYKDYIYIAPNTGVDLFSLFQNPEVLLTDKSKFDNLFAQLESIFDLISFFAIDSRLGL